MTPLWKFLSGKKRHIAHFYWAILTPSLAVLYPNGIPSDLNKAYLIMGIALTAIGYGHAEIKKRIADKNDQ